MKSRIESSTYQKARRLFDKALAKEFAGHAAFYHQGLKQLARAATQNRGRQVRHNQNRLLKSYSAKLVCLVRCLSESDKWTSEMIKEAASTLDPRFECDEKIACRVKMKLSGEGWRPLLRFGPKLKALQLLVSEILEAKFGFDEADYMNRGKGSEKASDWLTYKSESHSWFVLADIKDFYRSAQKKGLDELLGLPSSVINSTILVGPKSAISIGGFPPDTLLSIEAIVGAAREGLPQGSRSSKVVASILLGSTLRQIAPAGQAIFYGDDCALAAPSQSKADALKDALVGALASHPNGPLLLKRCTVERIEGGIDFLQYHHKRDPFKGTVKRHPSLMSYSKYKAAIVKLFIENSQSAAWKLAAQYRGRWARSFRRWQYIPQAKLLLWLTTHAAANLALDLKSKLAMKKILAWPDKPIH